MTLETRAIKDFEPAAAKTFPHGTQMPHGDVVPQTPQSEAGRDFVDDNSLFENMMSPNKIAKHGDGPGSVNLLGQLRQIEHLDIEPDVVLQSKILS